MWLSTTRDNVPHPLGVDGRGLRFFSLSGLPIAGINTAPTLQGPGADFVQPWNYTYRIKYFRERAPLGERIKARLIIRHEGAGLRAADDAKRECR